MEKNDETNVGRWVDGRLAKLAPGSEWQPNVAQGLARFKERSASGKQGGRGWTMWVAAAMIAGGVCLLAFLASRERAVRFWKSSYLQKVNVAQVSAAVKTVKHGQPAPDFILKDAAGAGVRLSAFKGKVVLLNFWATWCHGCEMEIPWFVEFENQYKSKGLVVLGVSMDDDGWKVVKPYIEEKKVNYPVVLGNKTVAKLYAVGNMPMTLLIDRDGTIADSYIGVVDRSLCQSEIIQLLGD
jgi:peroxiredoxin